jgi:hypothetical protein
VEGLHGVPACVGNPIGSLSRFASIGCICSTPRVLHVMQQLYNIMYEEAIHWISFGDLGLTRRLFGPKIGDYPESQMQPHLRLVQSHTSVYLLYVSVRV